jgi:hypothetical protein
MKFSERKDYFKGEHPYQDPICQCCERNLQEQPEGSWCDHCIHSIKEGSDMKQVNVTTLDEFTEGQTPVEP